MIKFITDMLKDKKKNPLPCIAGIEHVGELTIIKLSGDLDFDTLKCLSNNINDEMKDVFDRNILLDFKRVKNADSSTLAYLISLLSKLQKQHRKLGIINTSEHLDSYITIGRVDQLIHRYNNEEDALKELKIT